MMKTETKIRCSLPAVTYGRVLFEMNLPDEVISRTRGILKEVPQIEVVFTNPTVSLKEKLNVIDRVFPLEIRKFLKTACSYQRMGMLEEIFAAYDKCKDEAEQILSAELICVTPPDKRQEKGMEDFLRTRYGAQKVQINIRRDDALVGGFILRVGSDEYDWSFKGRMDRLAQSLGGR